MRTPIPSIRARLSGLALLASAALAVSPVVLGAPEAAAASERVVLDEVRRERAGIRLGAVEERRFGDRLAVVGEVVRSPGTTVALRSGFDGRVEELYVAPGDAVAAGQPLLRAHSHDILGMSADYLLAVENLRLADARVAAGEELLALDGISRLELERRRQEAYNARLAVEAERHHLLDVGVTEAELSERVAQDRPDGDVTLRAPEPGIVLGLHVQRFQWFGGFDPLLEIGDPGRLELVIQIAPADAGRIARGDVVEFEPVGLDRGGAGIARVISAIPSVDPVTRTVAVRARIEDPGPVLVPGLYVQGWIVRPQERLSPAVPESAVIRIDGRDHVFVGLSADTFEARPVTLGAFDGERYEIVEGPQPGEPVAVAGVFLLKSALLGQGAE